ncbi:hypothetical protein H5410_002557 [Solanum commersonii]|uniref:Uncharacterized protein n=1 Tax=Solanum commersonii TaxID=4109 RepID=A0A9J6B2F8_SOLCO|nr:hypothetical protein H5410_002557 [Solanum commersonii]
MSNEIKPFSAHTQQRAPQLQAIFSTIFGPNIPCASSIVNIQLKSTILCLTLLRLQANLSRELVTEKILLYNLSLIDTSHTQFEVTIQDDSSSTTVMISDKIGEELLSLIVAEIYDICCIKLKHSTISCFSLKNLSCMISFHLSETIVVTHTHATQTAREERYC